jgi:hypothetical protein
MRKIAAMIVWTVLALSVGVFLAGYVVLKVAQIPPPPGLTYGMLTLHWLASMAAAVLAFGWSFPSMHRPFWTGVVLSLLAIGSSYWGLTRIHIDWSQTVNGHLQWRFDSGWLFTASLVLGVLALAHTLWKSWRSFHVA